MIQCPRLVHDAPYPNSSGQPSTDGPGAATKPSPPEGPALKSGAILGLRVITSGSVISLLGRDNYTLGRSVEGQAIVPDIDLSDYNAFEHGVSRIHAEIQLSPDRLLVNDLDSANGTLVNGKRLEPQAASPIKNGDILQLGNMKLQIISRMRQ
jgi:pSer/pThr/pTyr-binding forkhead associated (FHA) protein